jgi:hypothetical protein
LKLIFLNLKLHVKIFVSFIQLGLKIFQLNPWLWVSLFSWEMCWIFWIIFQLFCLLKMSNRKNLRTQVKCCWENNHVNLALKLWKWRIEIINVIKISKFNWIWILLISKLNSLNWVLFCLKLKNIEKWIWKYDFIRLQLHHKFILCCE